MGERNKIREQFFFQCGLKLDMACNSKVLSCYSIKKEFNKPIEVPFNIDTSGDEKFSFRQIFYFYILFRLGLTYDILDYSQVIIY